MDGYYETQVSMPYFKGSSRQRGRGLGTLALSVGRTAVPLFKKFILPAAKRLGQIALESATPELLELAAGGNFQPKAALKRVARKTVQRQFGSGRKQTTNVAASRPWPVIPKVTKKRRKKTSRKVVNGRKSKNVRKKKVIRKSSKGGSSRFQSDIFANLS